MNLSVVRLCFQAFLIDGQGKFTIPVDPVFSQKVYDSSKSVTQYMYYVYNCLYSIKTNNCFQQCVWI